MSVKRHASYNFVGAVLPIALSLLTVPLYLKLVGPDRYGVLAIAWLLLGYFGLFDLGLGRATSFRVASLKDAEPEARASTVWSAVCVNLVMGVVGGVVLWGVASYFFGHVLKAPDALRPEILAGVPMLAAAVPVATVTGVLTGALQGREKFLDTNVINVSTTTLFQLLPLGVAYFVGPSLPLLLTVAILARVLAIFALGYRCHRELFQGIRPRFDRNEIPFLLKFGGWVNLTSIVGPILDIVDRFAIGAVLGTTALAVYTIPFQLTQRIRLLPGSLANALFPRMTSSTPEVRDALARRAIQTLACVVSPVVLCGILVLEPFLIIWVGADMATQAAPIGRVLFVAFWANAFALVPFIFLQSSGRPDLPPKMHLIEIPIYLTGLYGGMKLIGLLGCALAFAGRCLLDYFLMTMAAGRRFHAVGLLAVNLGLLVCAILLCQVLSFRDLAWWIAALVLGAATLALSWTQAPADLRQAALSQVRRRLRIS
ncbi:MAG: oligosaccharide flippase family protein [Pseudomonadota bacterium]